MSLCHVMSCDVSLSAIAYEKILAWSPLLELVSVRMGGGGGEEGKRGGSVIKVMEDISLEVVLKSHAPEVGVDSKVCGTL